MKMSQNKNIKILQPTDWSFQPMNDYIACGGDAFSVSRFGYELFPSKGIDVDWIVPDYTKSINKILRKILKLEGCNLALQCELIAKSKQYDVIYYAADRHPYLLALARKLRVCKAPVLMVCHFSYDTRTVESKIKRLILRIERKLVFSSMDQIMFNCETLMQLAREDAQLPQKHQINSGWGADLQYYSRRNKSAYTQKEPYYFAAGGANRDYHTLFCAFRQLPYKLIVSCPRSVIEAEENLPDNIVFFDYQKYELDAYEKLRELYYGCKAVLLPILSRNHVANGASVLVEALACGKPIVVSDLPTNFLDVEKEGVGVKVKMRDASAWIEALQQLDGNQTLLEQMGKRSYNIACERYNYNLFTDRVVEQLKKLVR